MDYLTPILLFAVLISVGYLILKPGKPGSTSDETAQLRQELAASKATLSAEASHRSQETAALRTERDAALGRAGLAEQALARAEEARTAAERSLEETRASFVALEQRMKEAFAAAAQSQLAQSRDQFIGMAEQKFAPFKSQLDELARTNSELKGSIKTSGEQSEKVAEEARKLAAAMTSTNKQGNWGELQLERVAELTGMSNRVNFKTQESSAGEEGSLRPDMVVHLPGGRCIVVDAKAPTKSYIEACATSDEAERSRLMADFAAKVRDHARKLGAKEYWNQHKPSPDFVILFLPSEALFSAALKEDPALIEGAWGQHVVLATPTTLLSVLRTVAHSWQRVDVEERAEKIVELSHKLLEGIRLAGSHFASAGGSLNDAVEQYNKALVSLQSKVFNHGTTIVGLGAKMRTGKQLANPSEIGVLAHEALPVGQRKRREKDGPKGDVDAEGGEDDGEEAPSPE
ncbi:MAG: DNA recombination protein RmuC [Opitutales bacterium]